MNYLFYGKDTGRIQKEIKKIIDEFNGDCDVLQYDLNTSSMNEVFVEIGMIPFFCSHKVIVVKNCDFVGTAAVNFDVEQFEKILNQPLLDNILIMTSEVEKCDTRKKLVKLINQTCRVKNFAQLDEKDKRSYIVDKCKNLNIKIDSSSLNNLISRLPNDTSIIDHQLFKLSCYPHQIDDEVINALILKPIDENVFLLSESIINGKFNKVYSIYKDMVALSNDPIYLIAVISSQFRFYYQVKVLMNQGLSEEKIASQLKAHPYRVKLTSQIVRFVGVDKIMKILDLCLECDVNIKTGKRDKYLAFEMFLIRCKEYIV